MLFSKIARNRSSESRSASSARARRWSSRFNAHIPYPMPEISAMQTIDSRVISQPHSSAP